MQPDEFQSMLQEAGKTFLELDVKRVILVGDYDTDGLSALSLLQQALDHTNIAYTTLVATQLDDYFFTKTLPEHVGDVVVFVDVGATHCLSIANLARPSYILDHHKPEFIDLKTEFLNNWESPLPNIFEENISHSKIFINTDNEFEDSWNEFHRTNATLRILCKNCNLSRPKSRSSKCSKM